MKVIRRVIYPDGKKHPPLVTDFLTHYIDNNEIRDGFEKGKILKATIELINGHKIEYERKPKIPKAKAS